MQNQPQIRRKNPFQIVVVRRPFTAFPMRPLLRRDTEFLGDFPTTAATWVPGIPKRTQVPF
jgi:hypothetical protein